MRATVLSALLLLTAGLIACAEPRLSDQPEAEATEAPAEIATPEPAREDLIDATRDLLASLEVARDRLVEAAGAEQLAPARQAADEALAHLVADAGADLAEGRPVFPSVTSEQRGGSGEADDAFTLALTAANDAGGTIGRNVADALRDPLAGDLGAWQRDPAGLLALAGEVASGGGDLHTTEAAVRELPGEGTRAIAWTMLAAEADSIDEVTAYAERGATHLDFAVAALEAALGDLADGDRETSS
ncbi:hypothetical protein [Egicoccus sp. AB-alg6-2]|uniref:hypothetical protein n=1 Tax=Egicoccus sp. AB-alg6-2 TaxID=3242692 RepID=UPI00359DD5C0